MASSVIVRRAAVLVALCGMAWVLPARAQVNVAPNDDEVPLLLQMVADHGVLTHGCGKQCVMRGYFARGLNPDGSPMAIVGLPGSGDGKTDAHGDDGNGGGSREASSATDVLHNALDIEIFPSTSVITGSNTITVKSLVNGLAQFTFRLRSNYSITTLTVDGVGASSAPTGTYGRLVTLPHAYNAGDVFTLVIGYTGTAVSRGFGSIEFTTLGGNPGVFTLSEAYFAGTWWPTKDGDYGAPGDNGDKFTMEMALTAPSTMTVASNGLLQGVDTLSGSRKRSRWQTDYPIAPYLVSFGAATYNTWTKTYNYGTGTMPVQFFVSPGNDTAGNRASWEKCIPMMATYATIFGLYPFINEKYGLYEFTFGGGMEHQTMTGEGGFGESLTSHELAHQWWGDNVTCQTWNHIWLNEGFATYTECLWEERKAGGAPNLTALKAAINARKPGSVGDTVYVSDTTDMNRIFDSTYTYDKGAWVLHMLRHVVGDTNFFAGMQHYRANREGGGATSEQFFADMGETAGKDLSVFLDQWIYKPGAMQFQYGTQAVTINGQKYVRLLLKQVQSASYPTYDMPVDVKLAWTGGGSTTAVRSFARTQHFIFPIANTFGSATIDPDNWILETGKATTTYVQGPAKVLATTPAPGSSISAGAAPSQVTLTFSENITSVLADYVVTRNGSPVPMTLSYSSGTQTATLNAGGPLAPGVYQVVANDSIKTVTGALALDGEYAGAFPSGDGLPGTDFVMSFLVDNCPSDFDQDGFVNGDDFDAFVAAFDAGDSAADFNGDGFVNGDDFDAYVVAFEAGC